MKLLLLSLLPALASAAPLSLRYDAPATKWESQGLPLGNGSLGVVAMPDVKKDSMQFTVDSLWTGDENPTGAYKPVEQKPGEGCFGSFQNMGWIDFTMSHDEKKVADFSRELNIANATHTTSWMNDGTKHLHEAFTSAPDQVLVWRFSASKEKSVSGLLEIKGNHEGKEKVELDGDDIRLSGTLENGLQYEARLRVLLKGGKLEKENNALRITDADDAMILLAAKTNYVMDPAQKWMSGDPSSDVKSRIDSASAKTWQVLLDRHEKDYHNLFDRVSIELGETSKDVLALPTNKRIQRYREGAKDLPRPCLDPDLEELLFQYGRYLLIGCSRPGSLPANLQGVWNDKNKPAWFSDYHSNINIQMNYWLAEVANLPELMEPFFSLLTKSAPVYQKYTEKKYHTKNGYVTRMSINPFGGTGWNWNIEGTAWLALHFWEHYAFSNDKRFLAETGYPWMKDVSLFWLDHLKKLPDGSLVVPHVWSHEHGPYEDGTAHAQQLMYNLFSNTLSSAKVLGIDAALQSQLEQTRSKLVGPKIGSWGQIMEWMEEKPDLEKSGHRHTSHLFAVYPGSQINRVTTPELAKAAELSLTSRGESGDSRRSWTWAWRTALWARLGNADRAHGCVAGMLAYNMMDNFWTTHPPFQIDGNLGITACMAEMFVQSQAGEIELLPALPDVWKNGSVKGIRARGGFTVDLTWKNGKLTQAVIHSDQNNTAIIHYAKIKKSITIKAGENVSMSF